MQQHFTMAWQLSPGLPLLVLGWLLAHSQVQGSPIGEAGRQAQLTPAAAKVSKDGRSRLRGMVAERRLENATALQAIGHMAKAMPCQCDLGKIGWLPSLRQMPKCIFIDLGAADGNTLKDFVCGKYGPLANCPSGEWEATLVEANPRFNAPLKEMEVVYPGKVKAESSHAAYMCEAQTTFYLDTTSVEHNYWGSSMSANHVDTKKSGHQPVTVPTVNVLKLLYESTIPDDYVILKMDIEGAEWDVLPCLAKSENVHLVNRLLVEVHPEAWGNAGTTQAQLDQALATLRSKGVDIPMYHSQTL